MTDFIANYQEILHTVAKITVHTLELVGILIIIIGSLRAVVQIFQNIRNKKHVNVTVSLGKALALALEFKMGAEIVNTVIVRDLKELGILAIVIGLRAILSLLIHWEIQRENKIENEVKE